MTSPNVYAEVSEGSADAVKIDKAGYERFQDALWASNELLLTKLIQDVIGELKSCPASGIFGDDVMSRHLWDEYSWHLIEGSYDAVPMLFGGSMHDAFFSTTESFIVDAIEKLSRLEQMALTLQVYRDDDTLTHDLPEDVEPIGDIFLEGICSLVRERLDQRACLRNLDLIGPHRADTFSMFVSVGGVIGEALDAHGLAYDLLSENIDVLLSADPDELLDLSEQILEQYLTILSEDAENADGHVLAFLESFEGSIKQNLLKNEIVPWLKGISDDIEAALL